MFLSLSNIFVFFVYNIPSHPFSVTFLRPSKGKKKKKVGGNSCQKQQSDVLPSRPFLAPLPSPLEPPFSLSFPFLAHRHPALTLQATNSLFYSCWPQKEDRKWCRTWPWLRCFICRREARQEGREERVGWLQRTEYCSNGGMKLKAQWRWEMFIKEEGLA